MSTKPGSNVASGQSIVVSPAAALISLDGAICAILSPSITMAWFAFNSPVRTLSTRPARMIVFFGAGACALDVVAIPARAAKANAITICHRRIFRFAIAGDGRYLKPFFQAPRSELTIGTRSLYKY